MDSRCQDTIGKVFNPNHGARKLRKAVQSQWLGRRTFVCAAAIDPMDHPHGGGERHTKGGTQPLMSP